MSLLWGKVAEWKEPDEDWRNAKPNKYGKKPEELYGNVGHVDEYFQGGSGRPVPWPEQNRRKDIKDYDNDKVHEELRKPATLHPVDPRILKASQGGITREGVSHYLTGGDHEKTGQTYADQGNEGNKHPVVYVHDNGDHVILSGHHRAAAALFEGRPLRARIVRGGRPPR